MTMKSLAQFVHDWSGKGIDYDHVYGFQCVDLVRQYLLECWGAQYEPVPLPYAINWFQSEPPAKGQQILWIKNDVGNAGQFPRAGDIIVWHADWRVGTGSMGHIDVFLSGDGYTFTGFDQNWPVGSKAHTQHHDYRGVQGWGRPLKVVVNPTPAVPTVPVDVPSGPSWDDVEDRGHRIHEGGS